MLIRKVLRTFLNPVSLLDFPIHCTLSLDSLKPKHPNFRIILYGNRLYF